PRMASRKSKSARDLFQVPDLTKPPLAPELQRWFREYPLLRRAFDEAKRRYADLEGVCGIGVGRKFSEKRHTYGPTPDATGGLCIQIAVREKKAAKGRERLPKWMMIAPRKGAKRRRVLIDVVTVGTPGLGGALQEGGRSWPSARSILPGRLFAFGKHEASQVHQPFRSNEVRFGTAGAVIAIGDRHFAASAGHVFTVPCDDTFDAPAGTRAIGADGRRWVAIREADFSPRTIRPLGVVYDAVLFEVPSALRASSYAWPDRFLFDFAHAEDVQVATQSEVAEAFVWVEREGHDRPRGLPVDLLATFTQLTIPVDCSGQSIDLAYGRVFKLRFIDDRRTIGGDSGAPVFVRAADGSGYRLLGFHFLCWNDSSYAFDARFFFGEVLGRIWPDDF